MDVSTQVDSIVQNLVKDIETRLNAAVEKTVNSQLTQRLENFDFEKRLNLLASLKLDNIMADLQIDKSQIQTKLDNVSSIIVNEIESDCRKNANDLIRTKIYNDLDINTIIREVIASELDKKITTINFPPNSIPAISLNQNGLSISGDTIHGGIIKNFSSTGIDDRSNDVQMTLIDEGVIIENKMVTLGLEVKGTTILEGDLVVRGNIPPSSKFYTSIVENTTKQVTDSLNEDLFSSYASLMFEKIKTDGLDLSKIALNGATIVEGNKLGYHINDTNISRLGIVNDLQTRGESFLSETLYTTKRKVGINTIEPANTLSIWDEEVEIGMGKLSKNTAFITTPRNQNIVIGVGNNENLVLDTDGGVTTKSIKIGKVDIISVNGTPSFSSDKGTVAFNENPHHGSVIGWVSLGNGVWAKFGNIE